MTTLLVAGLLLAVFGSVIAYAAWPAEEVGILGTDATGPAVWALIGCFVALIGQLMGTVSVIAVGVR